MSAAPHNEQGIAGNQVIIRRNLAGNDQLVAVPVTGLLGYYYGNPFGDIHAWAKPVFVGLIALHGLAALYHQFWVKDGTLTRMLKEAK